MTMKWRGATGRQYSEAELPRALLVVAERFVARDEDTDLEREGEHLEGLRARTWAWQEK